MNLQRPSRLSERVSGRFQALDRLLRIDHRGRSEWIWAVPILTFAGAFTLVAVVGAVTSGVTPALYVPIGLIVAAATAGMSIAYMTPEPDSPGDEGGDDGGQKAREPAPQPTRPSPGLAWWDRPWPDGELADEPTPEVWPTTAPSSDRELTPPHR